MTPTKRPNILRAAILATVLTLAACGGTDPAQSTVVDTDTQIVADSVGDDIDAVVSADAESTTTAATAAAAENQESHFDADDLDVDESDVVEITLDGTFATADSSQVTVEGATVTITAEGIYSLSGTLSDGEVIVDVGDEDDVTLILDGVDITNSDGAAIAVMNADDAVVLLADDSTNSLTDGAVYSFPDAETDEPNATLFSEADLTIAGDGELVVTGNYNDGINSDDGLVIDGGTISVVAADDGIRGKDYVIVNTGTITVEAVGDGIKADNDEEAERGYVQITDGTVDLLAGDDGIQAATDVLVIGGQLTIEAGSVSGTGRAIQSDVMVDISGGVIDATAVDDAIHSNDAVTIDGGTITLAAGDDGVHGDLAVNIGGGSITITESFEGIESEVITIDDGFVDITSSDDGLNVASAEADASTEPASGGRGGGGGDDVGDHYIYINGGTTVITVTGDLNEQGDGIDANGYVEMSGGLVVVSGPTDTRNSALDYSGGSFTMTGGTIIGTNVDGRNSEGIGAGQASLYITLGSTIPAGTVVQITNADGESLVTFEPANDYSVIVFSSPDLVDGESYDVSLGGTVVGDSATDLYDEITTPGEFVGTASAST